MGAGVLLVAVVLAGCGTETEQAPSTDPEVAPYPPHVKVVDGELWVSCSGDGWPVSRMVEGLPAELSDAEAEQIFAALLADPLNRGELRSWFPDGPRDTEWRLLRVDGDSYTFGLHEWSLEGPGDGALVLSAERRGDGWHWTGGNDCHVLQPVTDGSDGWWATVGVPPGGLDRDTREPAVTVTELACTSSRDPSAFLHEPYVVETDDAVTVFWTSTPPERDQTCPGNPSVQRSIRLEQPLGDRQLLDGSRYPPTPVG